MAAYIFKRIILIFPTLFFISLIAFALSKLTPQDPVNSVLTLRGVDPEGIDRSLYNEVYTSLGQDLPLFYFSILPRHYPATLNHISDRQERALYARLLENGLSAMKAEQVLIDTRTLKEKLTATSSIDSLLVLERSMSDMELFLDKMGVSFEKKDRVRLLLPSLRWHGVHNQYHQWVEKIFTAGFGPSIADGKTAISKVGKAIQWTLSFTLIDLFLSILLGVCLGVYLNLNPGGRRQGLLRQVLYFFYALPVFWLATMAVVYFTTDDYGSWTNIFPSVGMDIYPGKSTIEQIFMNMDKLILPILCLTLHSLAYVTRMVENSLQDEMRKDYVLLAMSMGLDRKRILFGQVLKNALIPAITVFTAAFAGAFSGSLVLEVIFNIPGMGRLLFNALSIADWNVVFCILMVLSLVTVLAYLLGDILYARFNPRIKYSA